MSAKKDAVSFKPILGIRPGLYLTVLYAVFLLLILFFLLIFPGIRNPHSRIHFSSDPWGSAVRMDDTYIGTTPFSFDVPDGTHRFTFVLPGFNEKSQDIDVKGRLFASLFFPKKITIHETIETDDPVNALVLGAKAFSEWSFAGEATVIFQHPTDLSNAAYRIGFVSNDDGRNSIQEIIKASARFASAKTAARDVIRAKFLTDNAGKAASPLSIITSIKDIAEYVSDAEASSFWLASLLPENEAARIIESSWYKNEAENNAAPVFGAYNSDVTRIKNISFRRIPANGASLYNKKLSGDFWIAENCITQSDWDAFVNENPKWSVNNIDVLVSEGLVTDAYLMEINDSRYPHPIVPGISWFAAKAYCDWLSASINTSGNYVVQVPAGTNKEVVFDQTTREVRLPTELEWEYAALYSKNAETETGTSPMRMIGSFWEWCEDPFTPLNTFPASGEAIDLVSSPKRSLRGASSWVDSRISSGISTRGSLEAKSSSPFVSFRPVIVIKKGNVL